MAVFIVTLPDGAAPITDGVNQMVVVGSDAAEAKAQASEYAAANGMEGAEEAFAQANTQQVGAGEGIWALSSKGTVFTAAQATASSD